MSSESSQSYANDVIVCAYLCSRLSSIQEMQDNFCEQLAGMIPMYLMEC